MALTDDFAAWSLEFGDRLRDCTDLTTAYTVLTDVRQDVRLADYNPLVRSNKSVTINWLGVRRYCQDAGYIRKTSSDGDRQYYRYDLDTGYYREVTGRDLTNEIEDGIVALAPDYLFPRMFQGMVEENISPFLREYTKLADTESKKQFAQPYMDGELIPFRNGIYSVRHNKLLPKTSYVFIEHPLNIDFNPKALNDPIRLRYMQMMCGDEELFELLFEQLGYIMYARTFIVPTFTIFYGGGSNGKSNVLKVLSKIVGERNISSLTLNDMANAFAVARSEGKMVNITHDSAAGASSTMVATSNIMEYIKKSTSGEVHTFNPKNGRIHEGYGPRKFIFATNVMLNFGGMDGGLARRMYTIPFRATFTPDASVEASFFEARAMEWFAMQSLVSLLCMIRRRMGDRMFEVPELDGRYLVCQASQEMKSEQMAAQDTILDWLSTELELDIQDKQMIQDKLVGVASLFETYSRFCRATGRQPKSMKSFHSSLKTMFSIGQRRSMKGGEHIYIAIKETA